MRVCHEEVKEWKYGNDLPAAELVVWSPVGPVEDVLVPPWLRVHSKSTPPSPVKPKRKKKVQSKI